MAAYRVPVRFVEEVPGEAANSLDAGEVDVAALGVAVRRGIGQELELWHEPLWA